MISGKFDYYRAESLEQAFLLMQEHEGAKLLAGGHSLIPVLKLRLSEVDALIDIGQIEALKGMSTSDDGLKIGSLTTHSELEHAADAPHALSEAAALIGDPAVRNRGTVGGSLAHADPASDLPTVFLALDASFQVAGKDGQRSVGADDFFTDMFETALEEDEILTSMDVALPSNTGTAYAKLSNPASRYAMVGCAVRLTVENGNCTGARVAIGGLLPKATRCPAVEAALVGSATDEASLAQAAQALTNDLNADEVMGDMHGSASYRQAVAPEIMKRALVKAAARSS